MPATHVLRLDNQHTPLASQAGGEAGSGDPAADNYDINAGHFAGWLRFGKARRLGVAFMMNWGFTEILGATLAGLLVWAAIVDLRTRTIPDWVSIAVAVMVPCYWWASGVPFYPDAVERIGAAFLIFAVFFGMFWMGGMGGGDVKLGTGIGLWFVPLATLKFFVVTSLAGGIVSVLAWIYHHKIKRLEGKTEVPYGVAIAFGGLWLLAQRFLNQFAGMSAGN